MMPNYAIFTFIEMPNEIKINKADLSRAIADALVEIDVPVRAGRGFTLLRKMLPNVAVKLGLETNADTLKCLENYMAEVHMIDADGWILETNADTENK